MNFLLDVAPEQIAKWSLYGFAALLILVGFLRGLGRRTGRSLLRFISVAGAVALSFFLCRRFLGDAVGYVDKAVAHVPGMSQEAIDLLERLRAALPDLYALIVSLPMAVVMPLVFLALFFIFSILLAIPYIILAAIFFPKKKKGLPGTRLIGALLGAVQGAVVFAVYVIPIAGYAAWGTQATAAVSAVAGEDSSMVEQVNWTFEHVVEPLRQDPVVKTIGQTCGDKVFDVLTSFTFTYKDQKYDVKLNDEIGVYSTVAADAAPLLKGKSFDQFTETETEAIKKIADDIGGSRVICISLADVLSTACTRWTTPVIDPLTGLPQVGEDGRVVYETFMDKERPRSDDPKMETILQKALDTFKNSTPETVADDLRGVADMMETLVRYDVLSKLNSDDPDVFLDLFTDPEFVQDFIGSMESSESMKEIMKEVVKVGVQSVVEVAVDELESDEAIAAIGTEAADILNNELSGKTEEEQKAAVTEALNDALDTYLSDTVEDKEGAKAITEFVAGLLLEEFSDKLAAGETVTADDITQFLGLTEAGGIDFD
ncbi:MAG: hypothetical protein J6125_04705 [Clostridia bacterium]|nr:hypothetical protein [Clostridia bacterium]